MKRAIIPLAAEYAPAVTVRAVRMVVAGFTLLVAGIVAAGCIFFSHERDRARIDEGEELAAVAELSVQGVVARAEGWQRLLRMLGDAAPADLRAALATGGPLPDAAAAFVSTGLKDGCRGIALVGHGGATRLLDGPGPLPEATLALARDGRTGWTGPHLAPNGGLLVDLVVPFAGGQAAHVVRLDPTTLLPRSGTAAAAIAGDGFTVVARLPGGHRDLALHLASGGRSRPDPAWPIAVTAAVPGLGWSVEARADGTDFSHVERHTLFMIAVFAGGSIALAACACAFALWRLQRASRRDRARALADRRILAMKYESLARYANDAVLVLAPDGRIKECNERAEVFFARAGDALVGADAAALFGDGACTAIAAAIADALARGDARADVTVAPADGAPRAIEARACRIQIEGETELQLTLRDVTELHEAQAHLLDRIEGEACLARIAADFLRAPLAGVDNVVTNALRGLAAILGTDRIALGSGDGETFVYTHAVCPEDDPARSGGGMARGSWWNLLRTGTTPVTVADVTTGLPADADVERAYYARLGIRSVMLVPLGQVDGTYFILTLGARKPDAPFLARVELVRTAGEIIASALAGRNSRERNRLLLRALEQSPSSIVITDADGLIEYVNPGFVAVTGYAAEEVIGKNPRVLQSGHTRREDYAAMWETIAAGGVWRGEFLNRRKNGELFWEAASLAGVTDSRGRISHYVGIKDDITHRRKLEDELRQSQKMEAVGRLAGGVAHDFNNILTAILGHCFLADTLLDEQSAVRGSVIEIRRAAERAARLTQQLLTFSRKQIMQPKRLELNDVIDDMQPMLDRLVPEHIEIVVHKGSDLPALLADPGQVEQVILNLVLNARDALPRGGCVVIETARATLTDEQARERGFAGAGSFVRLAISDNGLGMSDETLARCFEPFFTTKEPGRGTGLGLATVYGVVKQSGGEIAVQSTLGQGTRFEILLPGVTPLDEVAPAIPATGPGGGSETILVVEDNLAVRSLVRQTLVGEGYRVLEAARGEHALALCSSIEGGVDLLVTDVVMPGMSGRQLADHVTSLHRDTRVLYISGYSADAELLAGLAPGPELLQKPFTPEALLHAVRDALDRSIPAPRV